MLPDLRALLDDVRAGGLSADEFRERLTRIHEKHPVDEALSRRLESERRQAFRAFDALTREAPSRHHELERLAEALGVDIDPGPAR